MTRDGCIDGEQVNGKVNFESGSLKLVVGVAVSA